MRRPVLVLDLDGTLLESIHPQVLGSQKHDSPFLSHIRSLFHPQIAEEHRPKSVFPQPDFYVFRKSSKEKQVCQQKPPILSFCDMAPDVKVRLRPGLSAFLNRLRPEFGFVIWTAAPLDYAEAMVKGISDLEDCGWFKDELIRIWSEKQTDVAWRGRPIITKQLRKLAEELEVTLLENYEYRVTPNMLSPLPL